MSDATIQDVLEGRARWCVVEGDCLAVLPTLPDKSVAHVITDPPYSEQVHANSRSGGVLLAGDGGKYRKRKQIDRARDFGFDHLAPETRGRVADHCSRLAARWVGVFCDVEGSAGWREDLAASGLDYIRTCAWVKLGSTPQFTGDRPGCGYEAFVVAHPKGRKRWNGGGRVGVYTHLIERSEREHTTPKPIPLMLELLADFTDPDELVLDPFAGSGTTGVAALRLGRRFIGIEKDAKYAAIARERLSAESKGLTLRDARLGQGSLFGATP